MGMTIYPYPIKFGIRTYIESRIYGNVKIGINNFSDMVNLNPRKLREKADPFNVDFSLLYDFKSNPSTMFYVGVGINVTMKYIYRIDYINGRVISKFRKDRVSPMLTIGNEFKPFKKISFGIITEINSSFNTPFIPLIGIVLHPY